MVDFATVVAEPVVAAAAVSGVLAVVTAVWTQTVGSRALLRKVEAERENQRATGWRQEMAAILDQGAKLREELAERYKEAYERMERIEGAYEHLHGENARLVTQVARLAAENDELRVQVGQLERVNGTLIGEVEGLRAENRAQGAEMDRLRRESGALILLLEQHNIPVPHWIKHRPVDALAGGAA